MKRFLYEFILPLVIAPLYLLFYFSWRIRVIGPTEVLEHYINGKRPFIYAHWHGDELVLLGHHSYKGVAILSSLSDDGTLMARTLQILGYKVFRGSSSRGGARGLIGLIRFAKAGGQTALAVDGPKGPIYEVKPGIVDLAERTGHPIVPVRSFADRAWYIPRAWNKSYLPKPFAKVTVVYGEPVPLHGSTEQNCLLIKQRLDSTLA